ncbi:MAG: 30S ribosomal protein S15 [Candidatus Omnitrophica bacterium]|nr:30S ribosomal protein S15 [Candidatus Omnitrophota bacterium]
MSAISSPANTTEEFRLHGTDTGSAQVQVVRLTDRINQLSSHFQSHKKDFHSRQGLLRMVSRRRRLLEYLKRHDEDTYRKLLEALNLRK